VAIETNNNLLEGYIWQTKHKVGNLKGGGGDCWSEVTLGYNVWVLLLDDAASHMRKSQKGRIWVRKKEGNRGRVHIRKQVASSGEAHSLGSEKNKATYRRASGEKRTESSVSRKEKKEGLPHCLDLASERRRMFPLVAAASSLWPDAKGLKKGAWLGKKKR